MKWLNSYIIRKSEEFYLENRRNILFNKDKEFESILFFCAIYSLSLLIPFSIMDSSFSLNSFLFHMGIIIPIILGIIYSMKGKRIALLHKLFFWTQKEREIEVNAFIENNRLGTEDNYLQVKEIKDTINKYNNLDEQLDSYAKDIDKFCNKYLTHHQSLKRFVRERIQKNNSENRAFLFWCMIIPRKEELTLDGLKFLISQNRLSYQAYTVFKRQEPKFLEAIKEQNINAFKEYPEDKLKRIFSINYESNILLDVLLFAWSNDYSYPIQLRSLADIERFVSVNKELIKYKNKKLAQAERNPRLSFINGKKFRDLKFIVLDDTSDLIEWGVDLNHCIKTYRDRCLNGYSYLLGVYKSGKKYGNVELDSENKIVQVRGLANRDLPEEKDIKDLIRMIIE